MHHQIDALAYTNQLCHLQPQQKVLFALVVFCLGYLSPIYGQLIITIWLGMWTIRYAGIPRSIYLNLLGIPVGFWLISLPALVLSGVGDQGIASVQPDVVLGLQIGSIYLFLSQQGMFDVVEILARVLALSSCLYFLLLTTPMVDLLNLLRQVGCPELITDLLALMYRFISVLTETVEEMWIAQQARCGYCTWGIGMGSFGLLVGQLLWRTLQNYRQISLGFRSRGFSGSMQVYSDRQYSASPRHTREAVSGCVILMIYIGWHYAHGI